MGTFIRNYDIDKKNSFISATGNCLEQLSLISNKCNEWKTTYSDISEQSDFCYKVNCYFKKITEIIENSKLSITDVYTYAAMYNNDAYIKLKDLNAKLEMINLELKPLTQITKPGCNINDNNFINFITPNEELLNEIFSKRLEFYSLGDRWKEIFKRDPKDITDREYSLLANKYLDMDTNGLNNFFTSQLRYHEFDLDSHICPYWDIDKELSNKIKDHIKIILADEMSKLATLNKKGFDYDYCEQKDIFESHMQKAALLSSVYGISKFFDFGASLKINIVKRTVIKGKEYKEIEEYTFQYYENTLGDYTDGQNSGCRPRKIVISENYVTGEHHEKLYEQLKNKVQVTFNKSLSQIVQEEVIGDAKSQFYDKFGNIISVYAGTTTVGAIFGMVIKGSDVYEKYKDNKDNLNDFMDIFNEEDFADYYDDFKLNIVYCDKYDKNNEIIGREVFIKPSEFTYDVIERFNNNPLAVDLNNGNKITLDDVINDPQKLIDILNKIECNESTEKQVDIITDGG